MGIITFFDLVYDYEFRSFVEQRLRHGTENKTYHFEDSFPPLYRYRSFSSYSIADVLNYRINASNVAEFNDLFDGAFHQYGTKEEREKLAEEKWEELEKARIAAGLPEGLLTRDYIVSINREHLKTESRLKFRELEYLGTYICCFSASDNSTLMWSHYADSSRGFCVEYDFNSLAEENIKRKALFPVCYSKEPINLNDLLKDKKGMVYKYPLDAAVLCSALNKADIWKYEEEWRLILVTALISSGERRIALKNAPRITSISLGYHFLRNFFYYDYRSKAENEAAERKIKDAIALFDFIDKNQIKLSVMVPGIGGYSLEKRTMDIKKMIKFMKENFKVDCPKDMRYYYVIHDRLMDILEDEETED